MVEDKLKITAVDDGAITVIKFYVMWQEFH